MDLMEEKNNKYDLSVCKVVKKCDYINLLSDTRVALLQICGEKCG
jgi:hypothetical protein